MEFTTRDMQIPYRGARTQICSPVGLMRSDSSWILNRITSLQPQSSEPSNGTPPQQERRFGSPDMRRCSDAILAENCGNPNNGTVSTGFQRQRSGPSNGSLVDHDTAGLHGNTAGTDVAISAAGHGTPPYHDNNTVGTDLAISVAGHRSVLKPSHATALDDITNLMKEIFASLNGNPQLARDYPKWLTTLLGINGGVIITLISKSTSNNPQSLSTEIMESFTALSAVVGFSASLGGLYLISNKPQTLPFNCDSENATRNMRIVGGFATAFAFIAGVLLLLPNKPFRWIIMGLAAALLLIPFLIWFFGLILRRICMLAGFFLNMSRNQ